MQVVVCGETSGADHFGATVIITCSYRDKGGFSLVRDLQDKMDRLASFNHGGGHPQPGQVVHSIDADQFLVRARLRILKPERTTSTSEQNGATIASWFCRSSTCLVIVSFTRHSIFTFICVNECGGNEQDILFPSVLISFVTVLY
jgi:hypothetical protein